MKIKTIGTGAMYTKYNSACTLVNEDLIVDLPNGTTKQLMKMNIDLQKIRTILITHLHGDHIADIPFFLKHVYNYLKMTRQITIIGPKGIKNKIVELSEAYRFENLKEINKLFNIKCVEINNKEDEFYHNNYNIHAIHVLHGEEKPAYGYVINEVLGFTGDSGICEGVEKIFSQSLAVVADTSLLEGEYSHMGINDIEELSNKAKIFCTHIRDNTREELKRLQIPNVVIPEDGEEFIIGG